MQTISYINKNKLIFGCHGNQLFLATWYLLKNHFFFSSGFQINLIDAKFNEGTLLKQSKRDRDCERL